MPVSRIWTLVERYAFVWNGVPRFQQFQFPTVTIDFASLISILLLLSSNVCTIMDNWPHLAAVTAYFLPLLGQLLGLRAIAVHCLSPVQKSQALLLLVIHLFLKLTFLLQIDLKM